MSSPAEALRLWEEVKRVDPSNADADREIELARSQMAAETASKPTASPAAAEKPKEAPFSFMADILDPLNAYGRGAVDKFTLGAWPKITDALGEVLPDSIRPWTKQEREAQNARNPVAYGRGGGTGMALGALAGPAALAGKAGVGAAEMLGVGARPILGGAVAGGTAGALTGATESTIEGNGLPEAGKAALSGGTAGAAVGGGLGALVSGAQAVLGGRGAQARQTIERAGGEVGPTTSGRGRPFDEELAGLQPDDRGIGQASRRSAGNVLKRMEDQFDGEVMAPHVANKASIAESPDGKAMRDVSSIYSEMADLVATRKLLPEERARVQQLMDDMTVELPGGVKMVRPMTETELNDYRGALQRVSKVGGPNPSVPQEKLQKTATEAKRLVDEGPYASTNQEFAKGKTAYEGARNRLDLPKKAPENARIETEDGVSEQEVAKLANALARQDQNTVTSGVRNADRYKEFLDEPFVEGRQAYRRDIEAPDVLRAKADLKFSMPGAAREHGGLINRLPPGIGVGATAAMALSGMDPKVAVSPLVADFLARNSAPIAGRFLHSPAQEAVNLSPQVRASLAAFLAAQDPVEAYRQNLEERRKRQK